MNATVAREEICTRLSLAELRRRWQQLLVNPLLRNIPGKLELNEKGTIELTPPNVRHGILQAFVAGELRRLRPDGTVIAECAIETEIGVRVPDVAWASAAFMSRHRSESLALPSAPELCVEVLSPSNTRPEIQEKRRAYLAAGALEVWLVAPDGTVEMFDKSGRIEASSLDIALQLPAP
jgi:Uma2 family endonuclease